MRLIQGKLYHISLVSLSSPKRIRHEIELFYTPYEEGLSLVAEYEQISFKIKEGIILFLNEEKLNTSERDWIEYKAIYLNKVVYFGYGCTTCIKWEQVK